MFWAELDWNICTGCHPCQARKVCKTRAIVKFGADEDAYIDLERCRGCGVCVPACPHSAIRLVNDRRPVDSQDH